jgi:hypothetical protein
MELEKRRTRRAMKGANLGFVLVFFEIPAQGASIYRGFGSMISCVCRTPSPSFPIRWWFGSDRFPLRFRLVTATPSSVCYLARGSRRSGLGRSWAARERSQGRVCWASGESFGPWLYSRVKTFSIFQTIFQFANYSEFNSNLNFEQFLITK